MGRRAQTTLGDHGEQQTALTELDIHGKQTALTELGIHGEQQTTQTELGIHGKQIDLTELGIHGEQQTALTELGIHGKQIDLTERGIHGEQPSGQVTGLPDGSKTKTLRSKMQSVGNNKELCLSTKHQKFELPF